MSIHVHFYREQHANTLIQCVQHSKNRLYAETISALLQTHRYSDRNRVQCERSHPLTWVRKCGKECFLFFLTGTISVREILLRVEKLQPDPLQKKLQEYYAVCLQDFQLIFLKEFLQEFYEGNNYMQELCPTGITIRSI